MSLISLYLKLNNHYHYSSSVFFLCLCLSLSHIILLQFIFISQILLFHLFCSLVIQFFDFLCDSLFLKFQILFGFGSDLSFGSLSPFLFFRWDSYLKCAYLSKVIQTFWTPSLSLTPMRSHNTATPTLDANLFIYHTLCNTWCM